MLPLLAALRTFTTSMDGALGVPEASRDMAVTWNWEIVVVGDTARIRA